MSKRIIIDKNTGEIIGELERGDRIIKKNSVDYLKSTTDFNDCKFIKMQYSFFDILDELSSNELKIFCKLARYTRYGSGKITYDNGKEMSTNDIAKEFGVGERNMQNILKKLCDKEMICRKKNKKSYFYYMNPFICLKGNRIDLELIKTFEKSKFNIKNK